MKTQTEEKQEERKRELMIKSWGELMESGEMEELKKNYPDAYKQKLKEIQEEKPEVKRLAAAIGKTWSELMDSGDSELLKEHIPEVYKMKYKEEFGHDPKNVTSL